MKGTAFIYIDNSEQKINMVINSHQKRKLRSYVICIGNMNQMYKKVKTAETMDHTITQVDSAALKLGKSSKLATAWGNYFLR